MLTESESIFSFRSSLSRAKALNHHAYQHLELKILRIHIVQTSHLTDKKIEAKNFFLLKSVKLIEKNHLSRCCTLLLPPQPATVTPHYSPKEKSVVPWSIPLSKGQSLLAANSDNSLTHLHWKWNLRSSFDPRQWGKVEVLETFISGFTFDPYLGRNKPIRYDSSSLLMKFMSFSETICNS